MHTLVAVALFAAACILALTPDLTGQQPDPKQPDAKKVQPKSAEPKLYPPDEATLKQIQEKTEQLRKAVAALKEKKIPDDVFVEVAIYLKAAENIVRFEEWLHANSVKWALQTLDQGLERAKRAADPWKEPRIVGLSLWQKETGKWVVRAYRSRIDDSIQPYALLLPQDFGKDPKQEWPLDIILHGRDASLTEAKFIATHDGKAGPKDLDRIYLEVYGRGNNAYRWAGETDVFEALYGASLVRAGGFWPDSIVDPKRRVLRGFSMGGAGTWHIGLHHPGEFCVIGPGAGFTTTHGYVGNLPAKLPDYQEKCLRIYDAVDYAENAFNVPIVAYSGEKDPQKKAADNIENALKGFKEPFKFTHLVAPGLEHQMPAEWQAKAEEEYHKYVRKGREEVPERIRLVTYTPRYGECDWLRVEALEKCYEKAVADATWNGNSLAITTTNVRRLRLDGEVDSPESVTIDGQKLKIAKEPEGSRRWFEKRDGKWSGVDVDGIDARLAEKPEKQKGLSGPIDDAFCDYFWVVSPTKPGWHPGTDKYLTAALDQFERLWDRYFRGKLPKGPAIPKRQLLGFLNFAHPHLVLFGDPESNPNIAEVLPKLPITWTKDKLVVNGVEYDPKTHVPVLIYPLSTDPLDGRYVVINSGHTFKEADLKGTNALLYPRLGDWAVIKPTPTEKDPAAYEVVAAGLFDENWQFPKKK